MLDVLSKTAKSSAKRARTVMVFAPKGGVGKTMVSSNLLVAAAKANLSVAGLDFDGQRAFAYWAQDRQEHEGVETHVRSLEVRAAHIRDWRSELHLVRKRDVVIIDTPPGVEKQSQDYLQEMGKSVDIVVMPTEVYPGSIRYVKDFMTWWQTSGRAIFVLNKTQPNRTLTADAREGLEERGEVWGDTIPLRDDLARAFGVGAAATDDPRMPGYEPFMKLWSLCASRIGVTV
jgi:cellulose biosynthesis protein BcsQ